jgi:hypothetical protein
MNRSYQVMSLGGTSSQPLGTVAILPERDAMLQQQTYQQRLAMAGPTSARPARGDADFLQGVPAAFTYLDTTLGYLVIADGSGAFRNPATGASV